MRRIFFFIWLLVFFISTNLIGSNSVSFKIGTSPQEVEAGSDGHLQITFQLPPHFHISDVQSGILTLKPDSISGFKFTEPIFPPSIQKSYGGIYQNQFDVTIPFMVRSDVIQGNYPLLVEVTYQPCDESSGLCFLPVDDTLKTEIHVVGDYEKSTDQTFGITNRVADALEEGSLLIFLFVFIGGFLTSLTPCVYPMIPITIAVIGSQSKGGKLQGFILSLFYVLGIAITFSSLGMIAAKSGSLFGSYVNHPVVIILISLVFFIMGLSMLGVFVFQMPPSLAARMRGGKQKGFIGALLTGILAGLVVSPCVSPLLVVILTWVAKTGSVLLGFGLLFSFALGLGVLFIVLGTFSGILKSIPKSGGWAVYIERSFGILLIVLSIIFIKQVLPIDLYQFLWGIFLIILAVYLGGFYPVSSGSSAKEKLGKALGVITIIAGTFLIVFTMSRWVGFELEEITSQQVLIPDETGVDWIPNDEEGFKEAEKLGKRVIIDFYAKWCAACNELDEKTWSDELVQKELNRFVAVKLDLTKSGPETSKIQRQYGIIGLPLVGLFESNGKELFRFEGYKSPREVIDILEQY